MVFILCFEPGSSRFPSKFLIRFQCKISSIMRYFQLFFFIPLEMFYPIIFKKQLWDRDVKVSFQSKHTIAGN